MSSKLHHNNKHNVDTNTQASPASLQQQQQQPQQQQRQQSMSFFIQTPIQEHDTDDNNNNNALASASTTHAAARLRVVAAPPRTPSPRKLVKHMTTPSPRPCPFQLAARGMQHGQQHQNNKITTTTTRIRTVYLIRHGESVGQTFSREVREHDAALLDCGLTDTGRQQARSIFRSSRSGSSSSSSKQQEQQLLDDDAKALASIRLVLSSPLTRALETALLAFPNNNNIPIVVHYELRELGRIIPENTPRPMNVVLNDLLMLPHKNDDNSTTCTTTSSSLGQQQQQRMIDTETFRPDKWPRDHDTPPKVVRRDRIRQVFQWLASSSTSTVSSSSSSSPAAAVQLEQQKHQHGGGEKNDNDDDDDDDFAVAVVCHYHVIRAALSNPHCARKMDISPENAKPIKCRLHENGRLSVIVQDDNDDDKISLPRSNNNNNNSPTTSTSSDHGNNNRHAPSQSSLNQKNLDEDFLKQQDS